MLGSDKSRGYSLEMICADFLAGAALETEESIDNIGLASGDGNSSASDQPASTESTQNE
jgi:hypothetical protein